MERRDLPSSDQSSRFEWVDWFNHQRLFGPLGDVPAEAETTFYRDNPVAPDPARLTTGASA